MLTIPIWVNNHEVRRIELIRISPDAGRPVEGQLCTYTMRYYHGGPRPLETIVQHSYKTDDPFPLTIVAIQAAQGLDSTHPASVG